MDGLVWQGGLVGPPRVLLGFAVLPSPFVATTDSSYQNTYENLAILLGLRDGVDLRWHTVGTMSTCKYRVLHTRGGCGREYVPSKLNGVYYPQNLILMRVCGIQLPESDPVVQYIRECDPRLLLTQPHVINDLCPR